MNEAPTLKVDWESGEGHLEMGERLARAPAGLRLDVLKDWKVELDALLQATEHELSPDRAKRKLQAQHIQNTRRRMLCERLTGLTIRSAEPLVNGDVLLHLSNGRCIVLFARDEDVKLDVVSDVEHARRFADKAGTGDHYLREDASEQRALLEEIERDEPPVALVA
ncbi:hypothetical protein [Caldimonas tepidiphila]|uniref:hypothetical protein n=1 Tax=Caldimonas tepidiphila TaxID=2315841 RepID=UPI000E5B8599|nr:hypothetical protein [Caldimonas tepidiphila]